MTADRPGASALGTNQSGMRALNERVVLTVLRRQGTMPKADIARMTGLSAQTVSVIIRALEDDDLLLKRAPQRGRVGQPSVPMALNPDGAFFLGLKVGRRSSEVILTDFLGQIRARHHKVFAYPDFDLVLNFAATSVAALRDTLSPAHQARIGGLGIAMPFYLWSWAPRLGVAPEAMANWQSRDLRGELERLTALPVLQQNDASSACSAELVFGTEPLPPRVLHFYVAFFIGGGLILNNALYTGAHGNAAGLGPLMVPDATGHMRPLIDQASLVLLEQGLIANGLDGTILWNSAENWDLPSHVLDPWVETAARALAHAIHASSTLLDMEAVLIDGWMPVALRTRLVNAVQSNFDRIDQTGLVAPTIQAGTVGSDARALGAASLPLSARWLT